MIDGVGYQVVGQRYLIGSIGLTTNLGIASWGRIFDDPTFAAAMLDRLLHRSVVFHIDGGGYWMRAHRARAEQLRKGWWSAQTGKLTQPIRMSSAWSLADRAWGISVIVGNRVGRRRSPQIQVALRGLSR